MTKQSRTLQGSGSKVYINQKEDREEQNSRLLRKEQQDVIHLFIQFWGSL